MVDLGHMENTRSLLSLLNFKQITKSRLSRESRLSRLYFNFKQELFYFTGEGIGRGILHIFLIMFIKHEKNTFY